MSDITQSDTPKLRPPSRSTNGDDGYHNLSKRLAVLETEFKEVATKRDLLMLEKSLSDKFHETVNKKRDQVIQYMVWIILVGAALLGIYRALAW